MIETQVKLRVYRIVNYPAPATHYDVGSVTEGWEKIEWLTRADLLNPAIWGNVMGLQVLEDEEWVDWYDEDGDDIDGWAEKKGLW